MSIHYGYLFGLRRAGFPPTFTGVKLSVKTDYATRAVLGLARHYPAGVALPAETLAAAQGTSGKFLNQIMIELKAQGIVRSVRGVAGGYLLARPPADITLADVLEAVDGPLFDAPTLSTKTNSVPKAAPSVSKAGRRLPQPKMADAMAAMTPNAIRQNHAALVARSAPTMSFATPEIPHRVPSMSRRTDAAAANRHRKEMSR